LLFFLVALLTLLQCTTYLVVRQANRHHALAQIESSLRAGAGIFDKLIEQRNQQITAAAAILSRDHAFQEAFAGTDQDRDTTLSALASLRGRVRADHVLIASLDKELLFDTRRPQLHGVPFPFPKLIEKAEANGSAYAFVVLDGELYDITVAPLLAPDPIAWLCPMFRIDNDFAREIQSFTNLEITFLNGAELFGTTLPNRQAVAEMLRTRTLPPKQLIDLPLAGEIFTSYVAPLPAENGNPIALLQRSLDKELAPYLRLERTYLGLALLGLALSGILGLWIARGVSRPVLELAGEAREIAAGNYNHRVQLKQDDEIGTLAASFNQMSAGLAERDRVRDLLGKVVSPAIATELLRKQVTLGGEQREVTVVFSDLRNFTTMSEPLAPEDALGILNHYFSRMAAIVEKHGGVVDKYVGDGMMALFGAPVAHPDDADRALRATLEMSEALDDLNRQWQKRGLPRIDVGIGINTAVVVAGNMGSEKRLNYTVIGDGVNLASRLETLTKTPEYDARIIISSATLAKAKGNYRTRRLGEVAVKGKQIPTEIFALVSCENGKNAEPGSSVGL
jgi:adenylate cyclase